MSNQTIISVILVLILLLIVGYFLGYGPRGWFYSQPAYMVPSSTDYEYNYSYLTPTSYGGGSTTTTTTTTYDANAVSN